ncbi:MAG TPA: RcpC/CpaB family pilus assembly protein [Streptosporangiaceae bacterium]|nr:RcpC/CpaB family pilus assembly protein [Streptosporangiaceae bacterium]
MTRRILTVIVAILLAVVGTGAVLVYVKQADQRALAGQQAVATLVATQQIPAGTLATTALKDGLLVSEKLPAASVPADAVRSLTPALGSLVASADIASGELLLRGMLVTAVQATSGMAIPAGQVAVTIALCIPAAVAGYVYPGSQVAIFDTFAVSGSLTSQCNGSSTGGSAKSKIETRLVLPRVTVLAIGQAPVANSSSATNTAFAQSGSGSTSATQGTVLVTLAVSQNDAERVISLAEAGLPYLALLTRSSVTGPDRTVVPVIPPLK